MNVEDKVRELISRASGVSAAEIKPDAKLSDLDMESLEKLECVMSLEDALKVEIKEDDLWRLKTAALDGLGGWGRVPALGPSGMCATGIVPVRPVAEWHRCRGVAAL